MSPAFKKDFHRAFWKERREELSALSQSHSSQIAKTILQSVEFQSAKQVALYTARPWEVDLRLVWEAAPEKCFFPRSDSKSRQMEFFRISSWDSLKMGYAGIQEPKADPLLSARSWHATDLLLVPGTAFDRKGRRIGSGQGFYDRFLAKTAGIRWGVCFQTQVSDSALAQDPTDVRMVALCTEEGLFSIE